MTRALDTVPVCPQRVVSEDMKINIPSHLSDTELIAAVKRIAGREREAGAELVAHLAEVEARELHLRLGYTSLFVYCRDTLALSEWEAYNRIDVARTARRFPVVLDLLAQGAVTLTAVRLLGPHLTVDNHAQVLASARGKTKVQVEEIVARLAPRPHATASIRKMPAAADPTTDAPVVPSTPAGESASPVAVAPVAAPSLPPTLARTLPAAHVQPLSPDRYRLQLTISGPTLEKLRLAQDMLGHALPSGEEAEVLDRALTALLADLAKKKFADTTRPRKTEAGRRARPRTRHITAAVKRAVWLRDLGRCAFVGTAGHRCDERRFVEFHHVDPYALGGEATVDGIQLRCRRHNDYEGRLYFGERRRRELVPEQVGIDAVQATARGRDGTRTDRPTSLS